MAFPVDVGCVPVVRQAIMRRKMPASISPVINIERRRYMFMSLRARIVVRAPIA